MGATILIVEDEFAVGRGIEYALQQEGYTVKNARPAEINLNGFAFKVGIRIFFGGGR